MKRLVYLLLALTLLVSLALTACGQSTTTPATTQPSASPTTLAPTATQASTEKPQYGGTLRSIHTLKLANLGYTPDSAEPLDGWVAQTAVETLLRNMPDGSVGPFLATSFDRAPDYKSVTFHLRKGVKFHDGTDFNAQAVKYNFELYNKGLLDSLRAIESMDIIDDYTIKVNFSKIEVGQLLPFAGRPGQIESPTALQKNPKEWFLTHVVGTGPFKWESYSRDISLKFAKNPDYYIQGKPYLDMIDFMFVADNTTATMVLKADQGDVLTYPQQKDLADLKASGFILNATAGPIFTLLMDAKDPSSPFSNLKVRQAVSYAIDNEAIAKGLGFGYWKPTNQFAPPDSWAYDPTVKGYPYNPDKAKQLLTEAGYPNGFKTTIYAGGQQDYNDLTQRYLKVIGIEADIQIGTMANVAERRQKGWTNGIVITPIGGPPQNKEAKLGNTIFSSKSGSYPNLFHNQEIDDLIASGNTELDFDKRFGIIKKLGKALIDDYCIARPLYQNVGLRVDNTRVKNWDFILDGKGTWAPEDAWIKK